MHLSMSETVDLEACKLKTRLLVAAVGLPLLLLVLLVLPPVVTTLLVAAMSVVAVYELLYQTGLAKNLFLMIAAAIMSLAVCFWSYGGCPWKWGIIGLWVFFMAVFGIMIASHGKLPFQEVCVTMFSAIVVPLLLSAWTRIVVMEYGRYYILIPLFLSFATDSGAYFIGIRFGKHKMAPVLSPKKSWEGAVGGVLCAVVIMFLYTLILDVAFGFEVRYLLAFVYGILGSVTCVLGDLTFSVIKRQNGIKDYGTLLPGHGGVLDRFDSMVLVAPLAEALLLLLPLIVKG